MNFQIEVDPPSSTSSCFTESVVSTPIDRSSESLTKKSEQPTLDLDGTAGKDSRSQQQAEENRVSAYLKLQIENLINSTCKENNLNTTSQHEFVLKLFEVIFSSNFKSKLFTPFSLFLMIRLQSQINLFLSSNV
jgi:hypothetical protein